MEPLSARIPSDLYVWLATLKLEGASTTSDKLRVLLSQIKRDMQGSGDFAQEHAWVYEHLKPLRDAMIQIESKDSVHSDVMHLFINHATALLATLLSARPATLADAQQLEAQLVKRVFSLSEALLRQSITPNAPAFDPQVIHANRAQLMELSHLLSNTSHKTGA